MSVKKRSVASWKTWVVRCWPYDISTPLTNLSFTIRCFQRRLISSDTVFFYLEQDDTWQSKAVAKWWILMNPYHSQLWRASCPSLATNFMMHFFLDDSIPIWALFVFFLFDWIYDDSSKSYNGISRSSSPTRRNGCGVLHCVRIHITAILDAWSCGWKSAGITGGIVADASLAKWLSCVPWSSIISQPALMSAASVSSSCSLIDRRLWTENDPLTLRKSCCVYLLVRVAVVCVNLKHSYHSQLWWALRSILSSSPTPWTVAVGVH